MTEATILVTLELSWKKKKSSKPRRRRNSNHFSLLPQQHLVDPLLYLLADILTLDLVPLSLPYKSLDLVATVD